MYEQTLYKVIEPIKPQVIKRLNRYKKWEYGYNKEHDVIVISKTGKIGEVYEIQNLRIALPAVEDAYKRSDKKSEQYWEVFPHRPELKKIKTIFFSFIYHQMFLLVVLKCHSMNVDIHDLVESKIQSQSVK